MPYKNIHWVKLMFWDLMTDPKRRYLEKLDDDQKGLFLNLILLMGYYHNQIPNDPELIQKVLNLSQKTEKIASNLEVICRVFSDGIGKSRFIKFKNFSNLHNPIGKSQGLPKDTPGDTLEENREEKTKGTKEILSYFVLKHKEKTTKDYVISWAKEMKIMKDLLGVLSETEIKERIDQFFTGKDAFREQAGYTVGVFKSQINRLGKVSQDDGVWGAKFGESKT